MTEKLKQLLHSQATTQHFDPVDLDALVRDGDRRVRRRRWSGVAAGAVAAVAVVAVAPGVLGGTSTVSDPADGPGSVSYPVTTGDLPRDMFAQPRVTWSVGSVIHYGDVTVDVGMPIDAFVRTQIGFVFASDGGVWQVDGDAQSRIGSVRTSALRLVADTETPEAGWIDPAGRAMVFDHGSGRVTPYDGDRAEIFYAIDDGTAYLRSSRGVLEVDLAAGTSRAITPPEVSDGGDTHAVLAAEDDLVASSVQEGTAFGPADDLRMDVWAQAYGSLGSFTEDARYFTVDADEAMVYDVARGERVPLDLGDYWFSTGYAWSGARQLAVLAMRTEDADMEILTCEVPAGTCAAYTPLGSQDEVAASVNLPVGEPIGD